MFLTWRTFVKLDHMRNLIVPSRLFETQQEAKWCIRRTAKKSQDCYHKEQISGFVSALCLYLRDLCNYLLSYSNLESVLSNELNNRGRSWNNFSAIKTTVAVVDRNCFLWVSPVSKWSCQPNTVTEPKLRVSRQ